jgi:hypothetical protein
MNRKTTRQGAWGVDPRRPSRPPTPVQADIVVAWFILTPAIQARRLLLAAVSMGLAERPERRGAYQPFDLPCLAWPT